jgi:hypothetical protein
MRAIGLALIVAGILALPLGFWRYRTVRHVWDPSLTPRLPDASDYGGSYVVRLSPGFFVAVAIGAVMVGVGIVLASWG